MDLDREELLMKLGAARAKARVVGRAFRHRPSVAVVRLTEVFRQRRFL